MDIDWQQAVAISLVALAAIYIGWRAWRRLLSRSGCAICAECDSARRNAQEQAFVPIESLTREREL